MKSDNGIVTVISGTKNMAPEQFVFNQMIDTGRKIGTTLDGRAIAVYDSGEWHCIAVKMPEFNEHWATYSNAFFAGFPVPEIALSDECIRIIENPTFRKDELREGERYL